MNTKDAKLLKSWGPCKDGLEWGLKQKSLHDVFEKCDRSDWLIWLIRKVDCWDHRQKVQVAVACAERVLRYSKCKKEKDAIDAAKAWLDSPCEKTRKAASAAYADASAAASASADERKWQADAIRKIVKNPFKAERGRKG